MDVTAAAGPDLELPHSRTSVRFLHPTSVCRDWRPDALDTTTDLGTTWVGSTLPRPAGGEPVMFASFVEARHRWLAPGATQGRSHLDLGACP